MTRRPIVSLLCASYNTSDEVYTIDVVGVWCGINRIPSLIKLIYTAQGDMGRAGHFLLWC